MVRMDAFCRSISRHLVDQFHATKLQHTTSSSPSCIVIMEHGGDDHNAFSTTQPHNMKHISLTSSIKNIITDTINAQFACGGVASAPDVVRVLYAHGVIDQHLGDQLYAPDHATCDSEMDQCIHDLVTQEVQHQIFGR